MNIDFQQPCLVEKSKFILMDDFWRVCRLYAETNNGSEHLFEWRVLFFRYHPVNHLVHKGRKKLIEENGELTL